MNAGYGNRPRYTYAVGTSNGGYQVRRAIETAPKLFDGGVDWEGTFVDEEAPNLLTDLPPAILNFPDYVASGFNSAQHRGEEHPRRGISAGYRLDGTGSVALAELFEPVLGSYAVPMAEAPRSRLRHLRQRYRHLQLHAAGCSFSDVGAADGGVRDYRERSSGRSITVAGTMDALLPIDHHARAYARKVAARPSRSATTMRAPSSRTRRSPAAYRLYEVQNGNHIETYQDAFPQLELIQPHAQRAFDLLVQQVETRSSAAAHPVHSARRRDRRFAVAAWALHEPLCALNGVGPKTVEPGH